MRRGTVRGLLFLLAVLAGCQGGTFWLWGKAVPYEGNITELLVDIREKHLAVRSCQLEYKVTVTEGETTRTRSGTAWVRGVAVRLEEDITYEPWGGASHEVRVSDGRESWVYSADEGVVVVNAVSEETLDRLSGQVARWGPLALVVERPVAGPRTQVEQVRTKQGRQYRVEAAQGQEGGPGPWLKQVTWVDARDLLVRRVEVEGGRPAGDRLVTFKREHQYWEYEVDPDIDDELFRFVPPVGTRIKREGPV